MAASATPRIANPTVAVAYSGGPDSTALLWTVCQLALRFTGVRVLAFHVHHGLQADADVWLEHARGVCAGLGVELHAVRLKGRPSAGDSVEAWARRGRYEGLLQLALAQGAELVLLGQHADDQAETVLIQALRGGGPAGLAAMPSQWSERGVTFARPWLRHRRDRLQSVLERSGLPSVADPSNADPRFARSRLRQRLMPALLEDFPDAVGALAEVARQAAQAKQLAEEIAEVDLPPCVNAAGRLRYRAWLELPAARRLNVLQAWLRQQLGDVPRSLVERLVAEWSGQGGVWPARGAELRSQRGLLFVERSPAAK
jgi:tRNA(Ile)-lysidine synthase